ncbi:MAG: hypothetical protein CMI54_00630 [Parcubacteria group bacterium]|jgi:hypothetical protein|nr:hypothetical protein [Parcubacteria group bacterium]
MDSVKRDNEHRSMWLNVEAEQEIPNGRVKVSDMFWSFTCNSLICCTGEGNTLAEANYNMMTEYHQRR